MRVVLNVNESDMDRERMALAGASDANNNT